MKMDYIMRFSQIFIMIILVLSGIQLVTAPEEVKGQITPDVNVFLTPSVLSIDVSPRGTGIATTTAIVTNDGPHHVSCEFNIEIEDYDASPRHMNFALGPFASRDIPVAIVAMLRSPYKSLTGMAIVAVKSVDLIPLPNYFINDAGFSVTTLPYPRLILQAKDPMVKVWPGKSEKLKFSIINEGNAYDDVRLQVMNREELSEEGFSTSLSSSGSMPIAPREEIWMTVHIQTPKKFYLNEYYTIDVKVISSLDPTMQFDYSVTVWVRGMYVPGFDPVPALIALFVMSAFLLRKREE